MVRFPPVCCRNFRKGLHIEECLHTILQILCLYSVVEV